MCVRYLDLYQDLFPLHHENPQRYPHLLESVAQGTSHSRFDILFAFPDDVLELTADKSIKINNQCIDNASNNYNYDNNDVLNLFDEVWANVGKAKCSFPEIPFTGGWFVFLAYELAALIEPGLGLPKKDQHTPVAVFTRIPAAIIRDHKLKKLLLVAEDDQKYLLELMREDLARSAKQVDVTNVDTLNSGILKELQEEDSSSYIKSVNKIKNYITEGDVFQVNLSRRWKGKIKKETTAADIYYRLKEHNPAPFAGIATYKNTSIISSSPERLVKVKDRIIETRPIAGTRPRSTNQSVDNDLTDELITDPKERAEHIMLIDLERNDLGRVCIPGSINVNELMAIESYSHVHHIVSNVCGKLQNDVTPGMVIRAVFPGGTITGCPKVRCMEILAELEETARGPYTGSMGYINHDGSMDLNILIRTIVLNGRELVIQAGGGIVADSDPERELNETRAKARGLLMALSVTVDITLDKALDKTLGKTGQ
ncbi:MAG: aminodeoxychorismate synthase component I [Gammaproteobacteria bacterium]|nr:aminodeoxychorismate synthase component I [Gammaproteobacteria bacterium]